MTKNFTVKTQLGEKSVLFSIEYNTDFPPEFNSAGLLQTPIDALKKLIIFANNSPKDIEQVHAKWTIKIMSKTEIKSSVSNIKAIDSNNNYVFYRDFDLSCNAQ